MFPHRLHRGASHLPARRSRQNATFIYYQALSGRASLPGGRKETYVLKIHKGFENAMTRFPQVQPARVNDEQPANKHSREVWYGFCMGEKAHEY